MIGGDGDEETKMIKGNHQSHQNSFYVCVKETKYCTVKFRLYIHRLKTPPPPPHNTQTNKQTNKQTNTNTMTRWPSNCTESHRLISRISRVATQPVYIKHQFTSRSFTQSQYNERLLCYDTHRLQEAGSGGKVRRLRKKREQVSVVDSF